MVAGEMAGEATAAGEVAGESTAGVTSGEMVVTSGETAGRQMSSESGEMSEENEEEMSALNGSDREEAGGCDTTREQSQHSLLFFAFVLLSITTARRRDRQET